MRSTTDIQEQDGAEPPTSWPLDALYILHYTLTSA